MFYNPLFDLNRDGHIDAVEFAFIDSVMNHHDSETDDMDKVIEKLEMSSPDYDDLDSMDPEERREAFEEAGLDPDDFDDDF